MATNTRISANVNTVVLSVRELPRLDRRALVPAGAILAALAVLVAVPGLVRDQVGEALAVVADAEPALLWLAAAFFALVIVAMGLAWRAGVEALRGEIGVVGAASRYGVGSFVGALVPAGAGGAARIAIFSRALPRPDRVWRAGGISVAITAARALTISAVVALAWSLDALPLWPIAVFLGVVTGAVGVAFAVRGREAHSHVAHVLDVFGVLGRNPRQALTLVGWTTLAQGARVAAAASIAAAVGANGPLTAGLVAVAAISVASLIQLTPGNIGVGGGALALALHARGMDATDALSVGIAFQAVEMTVSLALGGACLLALARPRVPGWSLRLAGGGACLAVIGAIGLTVLL